MTKREVFTKAMNMVDAFTEEEIEVFRKAITALDKRSSKPTKAQIANEGVKADIYAALTSEPQTAKAIAETVGVTTNKVAALIKQIDGVVVTPAKGKNPAMYALADVEQYKVTPSVNGQRGGMQFNGKISMKMRADVGSNPTIPITQALFENPPFLGRIANHYAPFPWRVYNPDAPNFNYTILRIFCQVIF